MSPNTASIVPSVHGAMKQPLPQSSSSSQQNQHGHQPSAVSDDFHTPPKPSYSMSQSHSYSRSSPAAGYDGTASYLAYTPTTPGGSSSQLMSPADPGKFNPPGSQIHFSNTPLGLADIRPRADSGMSDSASGALQDSSNPQPGPSNYLAPWAVYAFDWCKWPPQGNGAGKVALGSYLEDGHNFVSSRALSLA